MGIFQLGLTIFPTTVSSGTLYVGGAGPLNYTAIQDAINASSPGDTIYVFNGTYYENVVVNRTLTLTGEIRNATIIDGGLNGSAVYITADWVNISGFTITNGGMAMEDAGIEVDHSNNCTITNNTLSGNTIGIHLNTTQYSRIDNNILSGNTNESIALVTSDWNIIESNTASNSIVGINLGYSDNNTIADNNASNNIYGIFLWTHSNNNTIDNNTASDNLAPAIYIRQHSNMNRITNNTASNNDYGIYCAYESNNTTISGNNFSQGNGIGIRLYETGYNIVERNNVSSNVNHGILILISDNNTISKNEATYNGNDGISLQSGHNNTIVENNISNNSNGIYLLNSFINNITDNRILRNQHGIYTVISRKNSIQDNNFSLNTGHGLYITSSRFNTIARNNVSSNGGYGIYLGFSWNNTIFHNNIITNTWQARDDRDTNQWDNGYPSGGNYWSNYTGVDLFSGPNYSVPGSDGFGDTPFIIDADSRDRYPLMSPYPPVAPLAPSPMNAFLSGLGLENVTLTWILSPDDGQELKPVVRYDIYGNTSYSANGVGYQYLASVPNGTTQYVDVLAGEGDPNNYFYRICAVGIDNSSRCGVQQLSKFTRPLAKGQNLISIPLQQSDESLGSVLQTVSFDKAWFYDSFVQEWKSLVTAKPYSRGLGTVNLTMGLWINVLGDSNLTVAGLVPMVTITQLHGGWNLVGFPSFMNYSVADLNASVAAERIEGFDAFVPPYYLKVLQGSDPFLTGHGYWVKAVGNTTWVLSNT